MQKGELRKLWLARRRELSAEEIAFASARIADTFFENFSLDAVRCIHTFLPIAKFAEIDTMQIYERIWREFPEISVVVPRLNEETGEMDAYAFTPDSKLAVNRWGISEPMEGAAISPGEIDLVLVPGLCFDRRGHRVGFGKGFYDRFLMTVRGDCQTVGLSQFEPVETIDDLHAGDVPVNAIVTPRGLVLPTN